MTNIDIFRQFVLALKEGKEVQSMTVQSLNVKEHWELFDAAGRSMIFLKGNAKRGGNGKDTRTDGFYFLSGKSKFTVLPPSHKGGVQQTSIAAYHSLDLGKAVQSFAKAALRVQEKHGLCTDGLVAAEMGVDPGRVAARRNDVVKANGVVLDKVAYFIEDAGKYQAATGKKVNAWKLSLADRPQVAPQGSLFTM